MIGSAQHGVGKGEAVACVKRLAFRLAVVTLGCSCLVVLPAHAQGPPRQVFVTSQIYDGNHGGLAAADALCNQHASGAGLTGSFQAWLSDATGSPSARFVSCADCPYVRTDGVTVAVGYADLTDGTLSAPINVDEFQAAIPSGEFALGAAWSATNAAGDPIPGAATCVNWTSGTNPDQGLKGLPDQTDSSWSAGPGGTSFNCETQGARLYCMELPELSAETAGLTAFLILAFLRAARLGTRSQNPASG